MTVETEAAERYFSAITAALSGLEIFMRDDRSPLYRHGIVAKIVAELVVEVVPVARVGRRPSHVLIHG